MKLPINKYLHELRTAVKSDPTLKVLFLSIGNPPVKYNGTRHNAGHEICAAVEASLGGLTRKTVLPSVILGPLEQFPNVYFAQSQVFMNESAKPVIAAKQAIYGDDIQVVVIHDDMSLTPGEMKFKLPTNSAGGHNGLKDIVRLGNVARLRIGIGAPPAMDSKSVSKFVLGKFKPAERTEFDHGIPAAIDIIKNIVEAAQPKPSRSGSRAGSREPSSPGSDS